MILTTITVIHHNSLAEAMSRQETQQLYMVWWETLRSFSRSKTAHGMTPDGTNSKYRLTDGLAATNSSQTTSNPTTLTA